MSLDRSRHGACVHREASRIDHGCDSCFHTGMSLDTSRGSSRFARAVIQGDARQLVESVEARHLQLTIFQTTKMTCYPESGCCERRQTPSTTGDKARDEWEVHSNRLDYHSNASPRGPDILPTLAQDSTLDQSMSFPSPTWSLRCLLLFVTRDERSLTQKTGTHRHQALCRFEMT